MSLKKARFEKKKHALVLLDSRRFSKLRRSRPIQIKADHPYTSSIQYLPLLFLILRLGRRHLMEIQIRSDSELKNKDSKSLVFKNHVYLIARPVYSQLLSSSHRRAGTAYILIRIYAWQSSTDFQPSMSAVAAECLAKCIAIGYISDFSG